MKLSDAANTVIDLAGKVRQYYETELPKRHPNYPLVGPEDESAPPPPEEKELKDFLTSLSNDNLYQLLLLVNLGRGYVGAEDMAEYFDEWKRTSDGAQFAVLELMGMAPLADYLLDGLEELRRRRINVDKMPLKRIKARKS